ncbi:MAG: YggS family pyridoxal phosphate-dependent enzyme [Prevotella sp.]|nr:YggS family pyridoxal phosphate-dependent enzyme [Prevotella sp.]
MNNGVDIAENLKTIKDTLPDGVRLVAVSKYHPIEELQTAYDAGQRIFGESHEQELAKKQVALPKDIEWHFIGHLQTNKVKYIAPYIHSIDAVDTLKLLREINKHAAKHNRIINVLLELHIAEETTKYGFSLGDCRALLDTGEWREMKNIRICGLMMMASNVDDEQQIRREFNTAADFFDEIKEKYFADNDAFRERSWGMSDDYRIAIQCRSTMVRIGTSIFGEREY